MPNELLVDFFAGCAGGAAGVLAGHPLDTVKVRLQTQTTGLYRGTWHCFTTIVRTEHVKGLYKGISSPLASLTFVNAVVFGVHGTVAKQFDDKQAVLTHFIAGCAAGMAQSVISAPTELLKLRVQLQPDTTKAPYRTPYQCLRHILRETGPKTLTRGMFATQLRDCPGLGVYFASYEFMARRMSKDGTMEALTSWQLLLAGGGAGMLSWLFNYPADVIKTRFQADDSHKSYVDLIRKTYAERGIRTFFVGLGSTLWRAFPTNAATFFTVEWTYRLLLDFNILEKASQNAHRHAVDPSKRHFSAYDLWNRNSVVLPEAGSTYIDPMVHGCRFI
ncbi:Protein C54G10.4 c [Aphelenchoides avenae]|nr:Protein C54G10.4 c [Aphelenchus avenae]